ncbi:MAG: adenosine-specific kinase [Methanomassiliicoccales archaeon]
MEIVSFDIKKDENTNVIMCQSHFIKTVEDVYETVVTVSPQARFGIAFNEASGKRLVRSEGNDAKLIDQAEQAALEIGCGHLLVIFLEGAYPISLLNALKNIQEIATIYCATSNPLRAVVAVEGEMRSLLGVMDGFSPLGIEKDADKRERKDFLRHIGYKK